MSRFSRREFLQGSALTLSLAGCARRTPSRGEALVSVACAPDYTQALYGQMRRLLAQHRLDVRGKRVLLKPNLVEFDPDAPINTHPMLVHAAVEAFRALGAQVVIGEGPGHRRGTLDMADAAGYFATIPDFEDLFVDLNTDRVARVPFVRPHSRLQSLYLAQSVLACDLLVSMPKMKTHHWTGATLSMKNLFGVVPGGVYGWPKNVLHWAGIHESVADLYNVLPRHFAIVDGIMGMQGNGPIQGQRKPAGVLVVGQDLVAVDVTCCQIMGIDPHGIQHLTLAAGNLDERMRSIRQIGECVARVRTPFDLLPEFSDIRL